MPLTRVGSNLCPMESRRPAVRRRPGGLQPLRLLACAPCDVHASGVTGTMAPTVPNRWRRRHLFGHVRLAVGDGVERDRCLSTTPCRRGALTR